MTNLHAVNIGQNKFCGPAVLSILTGKSTDECASVISRINGHYNVKGVMMNDLLRAADRLGFSQEKIDVDNLSLYRALISLVNKDGMYIVMVPAHFVCIEVREKKVYFCDNHTKEPIPAASSARLDMKVLSCYKVTKRAEEAKLSEPLSVPIKPMPSQAVSSELAQVINITNLAVHHRVFCKESDCGVSLYQLRQTAIDIYKRMDNSIEASEAMMLINGTNWY
jgi:hypothetical protein